MLNPNAFRITGLDAHLLVNWEILNGSDKLVSATSPLAV